MGKKKHCQDISNKVNFFFFTLRTVSISNSKIIHRGNMDTPIKLQKRTVSVGQWLLWLKAF